MRHTRWAFATPPETPHRCAARCAGAALLDSGIRSARDRDLEGAGVVVEGVVVDAEVEPPAGADAEGQALGADEERVVGRRADAADQRARRTVGHGTARRGRSGV